MGDPSRLIQKIKQMSKAQLPLQWQFNDTANFEGFMGHPDVVVSLRDDELPLFCYLWGGHCSGKTHLLSACSDHYQQQGQPGAVFSAAILLDTDLIDFMQSSWSFVALDDIHLLSGDAQGERHLFNLYNHCRAHQLPLILTSLISPRDPDWQLPDLCSRLQSGLTYELTVLSGSDAINLLEKQFKNHGIPAKESVMKFIAGHYATDYASLDQLLKKLSALSLRDKRKMTIPFVKRVIEEK